MTTSHDLRPGQDFAGYRLEAELGRGGMGVVYRAQQERLGRNVALKLIAPQYAGDPAFRQRFERESRLAAQIDHPHIIPVYEAGEAEGLLFIAMRYVPGHDLSSEVMAGGPLPLDRALRIVGQVASALDAAHANGLVHRDVKPANVLLSGQGEDEHPYLTDFGLSKRAASDSGLTRTGVFLGTVDYIAPEQLHGKHVDARADVYALTCLLFHAITGEVPFPREDDMAAMFAHANLPPPTVTERAPALPAGLDAVIARGMAKDPAERYPSAGDLARAAAAAARDMAVTLAERSVAAGAAAPEAPAHAPTRAEARRPPAPPPAPPPAATAPTGELPAPRRSRAGLAAAAVVLALAAAGAGALASGAFEGDEPAAPAAQKAPAKRADTGRRRDRAPGSTTARTARKPAPAAPSKASAPPPPSFTGYVPESLGYEAQVPTGDGWSTAAETELNSGLYRTVITGPGGLELWIDYTPSEPARFLSADKQVQSRREVEHPAFGTADEWVFSGGVPLCQGATCVDYLMNDQGTGYGVLAGGGNSAQLRSVARRVAMSLAPYSG